MKVTQSILKSMIITAGLTSSFAAYCQYDSNDSILNVTNQYLNDNSNTYNSEQIDVDGRYDRLDKMRRKLEKKNQQMVRKKIENVRLKNESRLTNQLKDAFNGKGFDDGSSSHSTSTNTVKKEALYNAELGTRVMLSAGALLVNTDREEIESKSSFSAIVEGDVSSNFSIGVAVSYVSADLLDTDNSYLNGSYYNNSNYHYNNNNFYQNNNSHYYDQGYQNTYGTGREMKYSKMGIEAQGKFFITRTKRFSPYIGGTLGVSRSRLSYLNNESYSTSHSQFGDEYYNSNSVTLGAMLGAQVNFTKKFGGMVELKGGKGFGSFGQERQDAIVDYRNTDQIRLENLGQDLEEAVFAGVNFGLFVQF